MDQIDLLDWLDWLDWLDSKRIILESPPSENIQHRRFIIQQLKPILKELENLNISNSTISEALAYYQHYYLEKAQKAILKPSE